jgi:hypothetical protein
MKSGGSPSDFHELFEIVRVLVDRVGNPARFLVLGSASPDLARGASETLAGDDGESAR